MSVCALSTTDNPFNPLTQFDAWLTFDLDHGYNSCAYLDRIARTSSELSDQENEDEIERAVDEIVAKDFMNVYIKVVEGSKAQSEGS